MPATLLFFRRAALSTLTLLALSATPLAARDLWEGTSLNGTIRWSHIDFGTVTDTYTETDLDLVWQAEPGAGPGIGAAFGVRSVNDFGEGKDEVRYLGGVLVTFGQTTLMFGAPWSPVDRLAEPTPFTRGRFGPLFRADYQDFALLTNRSTGFGAALYHEQDHLAFGLSARQFNGDVRDGTDLQAALRYDVDNTRIQAVLGSVKVDGAGTERLASLEVTQDLGRLSLTGSILDLDRPDDAFRALRLQAAFDVTDAITVDVGAMEVTGSLEAVVYVVNTEIALPNGLFLQGTSQKPEGGDGFWNISAGIRF